MTTRSQVCAERAPGSGDRASAWLGQRGAGKPYFLWVHLFDPHSPYSPPPPFRERFRSRPYDGEVAYVDQEVGRLLSAVKGDKTVVVVMSDHGESLGEHGEYSHGVFLYDHNADRLADGRPGSLRGRVKRRRGWSIRSRHLDALGIRRRPDTWSLAAAALSTVPLAVFLSGDLYPKLNWAGGMHDPHRR